MTYKQFYIAVLVLLAICITAFCIAVHKLPSINPDAFEHPTEREYRETSR